MNYLQKSLRHAPKPIKAKIYVQDPLFAEQSIRGICSIKLEGEPWLGAGPTSSRIKVVDYDQTEKKTYPAVEVLAVGGGFSVGNSRPRDNFKFHQANVWAVTSRVLNIIESGWIFGRRIPWAFPKGRLTIYPHAELVDNACYSREEGCLYFGYYHTQVKGRKTAVYTCLSHDTITHELGHAVLDGLKPLYNEVSSPDVAGFHEFFGDALAMTSALTLQDVVVSVAGRAPKTISGRTLVSDIASEFGSTYPGSEQPFLRSASNKLTMDDVRGDLSEHARSEVLTGAFYDLLQHLYVAELRRQKKQYTHRKPGHMSVAALFNAANYTSRMMLRGVDYCPPAGLTYLDYARAVLRADEAAYPTDPRGYREIASKVFLKRRIAKKKSDLLPGIELRNDQFRQPYDIDQIASSPMDAYTFIDNNRELLNIPRDVEFKVSRVYRTRKFAAAGYFPPQEVVIEFTWSEDVHLKGKRYGAYSGTFHKLWCGGTLVFDSNHNVLHYVLADANNRRKKEFKGYILYAIEEGWIGEADSQAKPKLRARVANGELRLAANPAMRHLGRRRKKLQKKR